MEDDDIKNWGYYDHQPMRSNLGLQLMPGVTAERDAKNLISHGTYLPRNCGIPEPSIHTEYLRDAWFHPKDKIVQSFPFSHTNYAGITDARPLQMHPIPDLSRDDIPLQIEDPGVEKDENLKKRTQRRPTKTPKPRKPRKVQAPEDESGSIASAPRGRARRKNMELVINGIDWDISQIATPVCTCTGAPQACYRWGAGGWQSACCTNNLSTYPLPMSTKRRGARIAGRKMSQGAFKKVLEKLATEGYNFSEPIDLRGYWAKHGTNKFVTIR